MKIGELVKTYIFHLHLNVEWSQPSNEELSKYQDVKWELEF